MRTVVEGVETGIGWYLCIIMVHVFDISCSAGFVLVDAERHGACWSSL